MQDTKAGIPILVFLSPGVDLAASVESMGRKLGFTPDTGMILSFFPIFHTLFPFSYSKAQIILTHFKNSICLMIERSQLKIVKQVMTANSLEH